MLLIADSGSTKTDWRYISAEGEMEQWKTSGLNPYFQTEESIIKLLEKEWPSGKKLTAGDKVVFYGAGVSHPAYQYLVQRALQTFLKVEKIKVHHDLLGAARSVCDDKPGVIAIMGTGSNLCVYDGHQITDRRGGWGYILSDEGSGNHIGRLLINDYLNGDVPPSLCRSFEKKYDTREEVILNNIYKGDNPSQYLAQFARFLGEHQQQKYVERLVKLAFQQFIEAHVMEVIGKSRQLQVVGSVGYHFSGFVQEVAANYKLELGKIVSHPIENLIQYHKKDL